MTRDDILRMAREVGRIDGTKYVLMTSERGLAVTPHVGTDGRPKGCQ